MRARKSWINSYTAHSANVPYIPYTHTQKNIPRSVAITANTSYSLHRPRRSHSNCALYQVHIHSQPMQFTQLTQITETTQLLWCSTYSSHMKVTLTPFTTGNPFLGTKLLGFSIGRGLGALKGLMLVHISPGRESARGDEGVDIYQNGSPTSHTGHTYHTTHTAHTTHGDHTTHADDTTHSARTYSANTRLFSCCPALNLSGDDKEVAHPQVASHRWHRLHRSRASYRSYNSCLFTSSPALNLLGTMRESHILKWFPMKPFSRRSSRSFT